jgi:hypothetical protein
MSFMLTTEQYRNRTKTVTRRLGWQFLKPGAILNGVEKGMGLKKGEKVVKLGQHQVVSVRREPLRTMLDDLAYGTEECQKEGFPDMTPQQFVEMFCQSHRGCEPGTVVTRIEFEYLG